MCIVFLVICGLKDKRFLAYWPKNSLCFKPQLSSVIFKYSLAVLSHDSLDNCDVTLRRWDSSNPYTMLPPRPPNMLCDFSRLIKWTVGPEPWKSRASACASRAWISSHSPQISRIQHRHWLSVQLHWGTGKVLRRNSLAGIWAWYSREVSYPD